MARKLPKRVTCSLAHSAAHCAGRPGTEQAPRVGQDDELGDVGGPGCVEQVGECGSDIGGGDLGGEGDLAGELCSATARSSNCCSALSSGVGQSVVGGVTCLAANRKCTSTCGLQRGGQWMLSRMSRTYCRMVWADRPVLVTISPVVRPSARCWAKRCEAGFKGVTGVLVGMSGVQGVTVAGAFRRCGDSEESLQDRAGDEGGGELCREGRGWTGALMQWSGVRCWRL